MDRSCPVDNRTALIIVLRMPLPPYQASQSLKIRINNRNIRITNSCHSRRRGKPQRPLHLQSSQTGCSLKHIGFWLASSWHTQNQLAAFALKQGIDNIIEDFIQNSTTNHFFW